MSRSGITIRWERTAQKPHAPITPVPTQMNDPNEPTPLAFHATSELIDAAVLMGTRSGLELLPERFGISGLCRASARIDDTCAKEYELQQ